MLPIDHKNELEVYLKEYDALRVEITSRLGSQTQLTNIALLLIGGVVAAIPFLFRTPQGSGLAIPMVYFVLALLIAALLFTSLLWTFLSHELEIGRLGLHIDQVIRKRVYELVGTTDVDQISGFFSNLPFVLTIILEIILAIVYLYLLLGKSGFIGIFVMAICLYWSNKKISRRVTVSQKRVKKARDDRVSKTFEVELMS